LGDTQEVNDVIFTEITFHAAAEALRSVRTKRYKYIKRFHDFPTPILPNIDKGHAKTYLLENGYKNKPLPREELYDLYFDPAERNNLIDSANHRATLEELKSTLNEWMIETNDALLKGEYPKPEGAYLHAATEIDPVKRAESN
jgi:hypothetical protein